MMSLSDILVEVASDLAILLRLRRRDGALRHSVEAFDPAAYAAPQI